MSPDILNAIFEMVGGSVVFLSVNKAYKNKSADGVSIAMVLFFAIWGFWNLYYYPSLDQMWSFWAGVFLSMANMSYLYLVVLYSFYRNKHGRA